MSCQPDDLADLQAKLAEAETAYHKLLLGGSTASVSFGPSKSVSYTQANIAELRRYINDLNERIGVLTGCPKHRRRAVRMVF